MTHSSPSPEKLPDTIRDVVQPECGFRKTEKRKNDAETTLVRANVAKFRFEAKGMGSRRPLVAMLKVGEIMELSLTTRVLDNKAVVDCVGRIVYGAEATTLRQLVKQLIAQGRNEIVLDLGGVAQLDSGALGVLAGLHTSAQQAGSHIRLANPTGRTAKLLHSTNLLSVFDISGMDTKESAPSKKAS